MPLLGFEPTISPGERPQTYALDRAATGTGHAKQFKISYFRTNTRGLTKNIEISVLLYNPALGVPVHLLQASSGY